MQPLGKDQNISCFLEPLTFVRCGRAYVKRTDRNAGPKISCYRMVASITNPREQES